MEFTGERFIPGCRGAGCTGNIVLEHYHRYFFASQLVRGKRVLDIASGEGYGSHILAESAAFVTGVDIAHEAVVWSTKQYECSNTRFLEGSVTKIPLPNSSVDVVVSFETLEHVTEQEQKLMLREIRRVLVPGGLLVTSTPNRLLFNIVNEFHICELDLEEFHTLLSAHFAHHDVFGQRVVYGSVISGRAVLNRLLKPDKTSADFLEAAYYYIALASDSLLPEVSGSVLEDSLEHSELCSNLKNILAATEQRAMAAEQRAAAAEQQLRAMLASRSWRITAPLRAFRKFFHRGFGTDNT